LAHDNGNDKNLESLFI